MEEKRSRCNIATHTSSRRLLSRYGSRNSDVPFTRDFFSHMSISRFAALGPLDSTLLRTDIRGLVLTCDVVECYLEICVSSSIAWQRCRMK